MPRVSSARKGQSPGKRDRMRKKFRPEQSAYRPPLPDFERFDPQSAYPAQRPVDLTQQTHRRVGTHITILSHRIFDRDPRLFCRVTKGVVVLPEMGDDITRDRGVGPDSGVWRLRNREFQSNILDDNSR